MSRVGDRRGSVCGRTSIPTVLPTWVSVRRCWRVSRGLGSGIARSPTLFAHIKHALFAAESARATSLGSNNPPPCCVTFEARIVRFLGLTYTALPRPYPTPGRGTIRPSFRTMTSAWSSRELNPDGAVGDPCLRTCGQGPSGCRIPSLRNDQVSSHEAVRSLPGQFGGSAQRLLDCPASLTGGGSHLLQHPVRIAGPATGLLPHRRRRQAGASASRGSGLRCNQMPCR